MTQQLPIVNIRLLSNYPLQLGQGVVFTEVLGSSFPYAEKTAFCLLEAQKQPRVYSGTLVSSKYMYIPPLLVKELGCLTGYKHRFLRFFGERLCILWPGDEATPWDTVYMSPPSVPPSQGLSASGRKYAWAPLPETHFWGFPWGENLQIWVNVTFCNLQTTILRMWLICVYHLKQVKCPPKHQRNLCPAGLSVQPTPNRSCSNNSILSSSFFSGSVRSNS